MSCELLEMPEEDSTSASMPELLQRGTLCHEKKLKALRELWSSYEGRHLRSSVLDKEINDPEGFR